MGFEVDDDILQDFLVEATEILEQVGEQLVELEQRPADQELLNAVFRGFHTVKGGAGFLGIEPLVEVCHRAEDVFNTLRQGQRRVDPALMDVVLRVVDLVNAMLEAVRAGQMPEHAEPELLRTLEALARPEGEAGEEAAAEAARQDPETTQAPELQESGAPQQEATGEGAGIRPAPAGEGQDPAEADFEAMLAEAAPAEGAEGSPGEAPAPSSGEAAGPGASQGGSDEITEEEFEALLDQLHGPGRFQGVPAAAAGAGAQREREGAEGSAAVQGAPAAAEEVPQEPPHGAVQEPPQQPPQQPAAKAAPEAGAARPGPGTGPARPPGRPAKEGGEATVRVDTKRLDDIMNLVGELVLVRNRLATLRSAMGDDEVAKAVANLDLVTSDLQLAVMKTRMQPVRKVFGRFPRVVRDLARQLGKEVRLELYGEDTDLDKNLVEALADPLVHLVRNAVDHGIEPPEVRQRAGKPREGRLVLGAKQEGDHILLVIQDDGAGMDPEALRRKAVEKGLLDEESAARLDEQECYNLIFMPGFSTKSEISDVSGRGVGMDVVKTRIAQLNGSIAISSRLGEGTELRIKLPLTLAIVPTLMVLLEQQIFALPLANVQEIIQLDSVRTRVVDGQRVALIREHPVPLFFLKEWLLQGRRHEGREGYVVVVRVGHLQVALVVDQLIAQEEVVIKPLGTLLQGLPGLAGATITGDGRIALILDMPSLLAGYAGRR
ncbi:MAG: chemotaxis protein CheA [Gammaproteobacteria bacterium]|nr:MAG: chemotaxis protein CheA [Gammaproteobacteria bacterium]